MHSEIEATCAKIVGKLWFLSSVLHIFLLRNSRQTKRNFQTGTGFLYIYVFMREIAKSAKYVTKVAKSAGKIAAYICGNDNAIKHQKVQCNIKLVKYGIAILH